MSSRLRVEDNLFSSSPYASNPTSISRNTNREQCTPPTQPAQKQTTLCNNNCQLLISFWVLKLNMVKEDGRAMMLTIAILAAMEAVKIISCFCNAGSISLTLLTSKKLVANKVINKTHNNTVGAE